MVHLRVQKLATGYCLDGVVFLVRHLYCIVVHRVLEVYQLLGTVDASYGSVLFVYVAIRRIVYGIAV
jgi:hypothetical protein